MQVTQSENTRVGATGEIIKFRPSPNFKNMKKFLKSRTEIKTTPVENGTPAPVVTSKAVKKVEPIEDVKVKPLLAVQVQPPLPPYPPPPDSPPVLGIRIKKEKTDEYDLPFNECNAEPASQEPEQTTSQDHGHSAKKPKRPMCKEFIRGNCKRPVCKFAHEIDLAQLRGVFTFCWNYQNDVCNFPNCRYVHADIFEEAEFYRTGILPPHARSHQKRAPPLPLPQEEPQQQSEGNFRMHPPGILPNAEKTPLISCIPASNISTRSVEDTFKAPLPISNPQNFSSTPCDLEGDHFAKKCKNCEMMEHRVQYNKKEVEKQILAAQELKKKIAHLNEKSNKLFHVLLTLTDKTHSTGSEKESRLEPLNFLLSGNSRHSAINDDSVKENFSGINVNLSSLLKLLCNAGEQPLAIDSRES